MTLEEMAGIKHIFITHSHLDHITGLPLLLDSVFEKLKQPVIVHAQPQTLDALRKHIFNNVIWPDFTRLPTRDKPVLAFEELTPGNQCELGGRSFEMVPVKHVVPAVGYVVHNQTGTFAFSGDTSSNDTFWDALNKLPQLDLLLVEAAFANKDIQLSHLAGHYCPELLARDLVKLNHQPEVYITHNKPGEEELIFSECQSAIRSHKINRLSSEQVFTV